MQSLEELFRPSLSKKKLRFHLDYDDNIPQTLGGSSKAKSTPYQLIYMDIGLPDKDGRTVTEEIRAWEKQTGKPPVPIIALTAHIDDTGKEKCLAAGVNLVLKKPISLALIRQHVEQYLPQGTVGTDTGHTLESDEAWEEILALFRKEIKGSLTDIQKYYQKKNWEALQFAIHKCNGLASYCAPKQLKIALSELEHALLSEQKQAQLLDTCFKGFLTEADTFLGKKTTTRGEKVST